MKILNKRILVKGSLQTSSTIVIPTSGEKATSGDKIDKIVVQEIAEGVTAVKKGDEVILEGQALVNMNNCVNHIFPKKEKHEFYLVVKEEDILLVVN